MTSVIERDPLPKTAPRDDLGKPVEPAPYFHDWDPTPHAIYSLVGMGHVELGDVVLGGTHQVDGKGRAEQRGTAAVRLDLSYLAGQTMEQSARLILPLDHQIEVKRYYPDAGHAYAWISLLENDDFGPTIIPDYGSDTARCCGGGLKGDELNPDGYEASQTMCDECADGWSIDYDVVRHHRA